MSCPRCNAPAEDQTLREFGGVCPKCLLDFSEEQDAPAFPNLEIVEMVGQGGMGVVYKARQKNLDRVVALKVLSPQLSDDPEFVERFTREARALASLSHPNIVGIYDSGIHDHVPYLVMEYVDGTPLRKLLASGKLTAERALEFIPQICDALHYAHARGVIHRDIKPENILVDRQGRVRIADFGLAKLSVETTGITRSGYVMGTPRYMAPEQFEAAGRVDHRADIYSLGVVFYEMLTGEVPMGRFKPPSEKAAVDRRLDPVVLRSLEREPADRWQTADEVKARVTRLDDAAPEGPADDRKRKVLILVLSALIAMGIGGALWVDQRLPDEADGGIRGPLIVIGCAVAVLVLLVGPLRGSRLKRIEAPTPARRQATFVALGAAAAVFVAIVVLLLAARPDALSHAPSITSPPRLAPPRDNSDWRSMNWSRTDFPLNQVWPLPSEVPPGSSPEPEVVGANALRRAGLPEAMLPDLKTVRKIEFAGGGVVLLGLEFATEIARRRWARDDRYQFAFSSWNCRLEGESNAAVYLRIDGSNPSLAVGETLWPIILAKWEKTR